MSQVALDYTSCSHLSCADSLPADVFLCIPSDKVAQKDCPVQASPEITGSTDFVWHTIAARMVNAAQTANTCGQKYWIYTFVYDDDQLVEDETLIATDISGVVCGGCMATWIQDIAGNDVKLERRIIDEVEYLILITEHGCEYQFLEGGSTAPGITFTSETDCTRITTVKDSSNATIAELEFDEWSSATQTAHGYVIPASGVMPLYWDNFTNLWKKAEADDITTVADVLAVSFPTADTITFREGGFYQVTHGLDVGYWYALSTTSAGALVRADTLTDEDILQFLVFTMSDNCLLLRVGQAIPP